MSRVGKSPVAIPDKTKVEIKGSHVTVSGPQGTLERDIHPEISAAVEDTRCW
jgi:large subunit ribosomal protein L6